jgi:hypothetical protein
MSDSPLVNEAVSELKRYKTMAEGGFAQISNAQWFAASDPE